MLAQRPVTRKTEKTEPYIRTGITGFLEYTRQIKDRTTFISSLAYSLDLLDRDGDGTITISDRGVTDVTNYSNSADSKIVWQFQTKDARVKLASLYPKIVEC